MNVLSKISLCCHMNVEQRKKYMSISNTIFKSKRKLTYKITHLKITKKSES